MLYDAVLCFASFCFALGCGMSDAMMWDDFSVSDVFLLSDAWSTTVVSWTSSLTLQGDHTSE